MSSHHARFATSPNNPITGAAPSLLHRHLQCVFSCLGQGLPDLRSLGGSRAVVIASPS